MSATPPNAGPPQPVYIVQTIVYARPARPKAGWSLVLGILSLFVGFTVVLPMLGFVLGLIALKSEPGRRGSATAGVILNGLVLLGLALGIIAMVLMVVVANMGQHYTSTSP